MDNFDVLGFLDEEDNIELDDDTKQFVKSIFDRDKMLQNIGVLNQDKVNDVKKVFAMAAQITKGQKVKVSYKLFSAFASSAVVHIQGKQIEITDMQLFKRCAALANNMDIAVLTTGVIDMEFSFDGLTTLPGEKI